MDIKKIRVRIMSEAYDLADRGDHEGYNAIKVMCGEVMELIAVEAQRLALETEQEPVAWISDSPTKGNGKQLHWTKSEAWRWSSNITPLYYALPKRELVGLTEREVELIDEMIETQLLHAERCDHMANSTMAQKQKAWDLERVELLRKLKDKNA
jgi:hypothetical protein